MLRNTKLQMLAVLAAGALLGHLASSGRLDPRALADAGRSREAAPTNPDDQPQPGCCANASPRC